MAEEKDNIEETKMPLMQHLIELRRRLIYCVVALLVGFVVAFEFADPIFNFLTAPLADILKAQGPDRGMIFTAVHEKFFTNIKLAFLTSLFVTFPVFAWQIWMFVAPGLYKNEKTAFAPFLIATPILFVAGAALVYYGVMPIAWKFFVGFEQAASGEALPIRLEAKVNEYLSIVIKLIFAFGICFQLPVAITLLAKVGLVSSRTLAEKRKYAIVIAFIAAALLTPPDVITQFGLAIPILILYELSIWSAKLVEKRRAQAEAEADQG